MSSGKVTANRCATRRTKRATPPVGRIWSALSAATSWLRATAPGVARRRQSDRGRQPTGRRRHGPSARFDRPRLQTCL